MSKFTPNITIPTAYDELFTKYEAEYDLPNDTLKLLALVENRGKISNKVSPKGASGIMQIMPSNFKYLGITNPNDPEQSIRGAAKLVKDLYTQYKGNDLAVFAHYNGGTKQGQQILQGKPPTNKETREYLNMIQNTPRKDTWLSKRYKNSWSQTEDEDLPKLYIGPDNSSVGSLLSHNWKDTFTDRSYEYIKNTITTTDDNNDTYYHYSNNPETIETLRDTLGSINAYEEYKLSKATSDESLKRILADILDEREFNYDLQNSSLSTRILNAGIGLFTAVLDPISWIPIFAATKFVNAGFKVANISSAIATRTSIDATLGGSFRAAEDYYHTGAVTLKNAAIGAAEGAAIGAGLHSITKGSKALLGKIKKVKTKSNPLEQISTKELINDINPVSSIKADISTAEALKLNMDIGAEKSLAEKTTIYTDFVNNLSDNQKAVNSRVSKLIDYTLPNIGVLTRIRSSGVILAKSTNPSTQYIGQLLIGNQAGLGITVSNNASNVKEIIHTKLTHKYNRTLENLLKESGSFKRGNRQKIEREVFMLRNKRRVAALQGKIFERDNSIISKIADTLDLAYEEQNKLLATAGVRGYDINAISIGYAPSRINRAALNDVEIKQAYKKLVIEDYVDEGRKQIAKAKSEGKTITETEAKEIDQINIARGEFWFERMTLEKSTQDNTKFIHDINTLKAQTKNLQETKNKSALEIYEQALLDFSEAKADTSRHEFDMSRTMLTNSKKVVQLSDLFQQNIVYDLEQSFNKTSGKLALSGIGIKDKLDVDNLRQALDKSYTNYPSELKTLEMNTINSLLNTFNGTPTASTYSTAQEILGNIAYSTMMGKLPISIISDLPVLFNTLGKDAVFSILGSKSYLNGEALIHNGKLTKLGEELDFFTSSIISRDSDLFRNNSYKPIYSAFAQPLVGLSKKAVTFTEKLSFMNKIGAIAEDKLSKASYVEFQNILKGKSSLDEKRLNLLGLYPRDLKILQNQTKKYADAQTIGLDLWDSTEAKNLALYTYNNLVHQTSLNKVRIGESLDILRDSPLAKLFSRYRAIGPRATEKVLSKYIGYADKRAIATGFTAFSFAYLLANVRYELDTLTKGEKKPKKSDNKQLDLIHRTALMSSSLGYAGEITDCVSAALGHRPFNPVSIPILNPIVDAAKLAQLATQGKTFTKEGINKIKNITPGGNTYPGEIIFNKWKDKD